MGVLYDILTYINYISLLLFSWEFQTHIRASLPKLKIYALKDYNYDRYLEAERYNNRLRHTKPRPKDMTTSAESVLETLDRQEARDTIVEVACASLPQIANKVATFALQDKDFEPHGEDNLY